MRRSTLLLLLALGVVAGPGNTIRADPPAEAEPPAPKPEPVVKDNDNYLRLWDVDRGAVAHVWHDEAAGAHAVAFSPDGQRLATAAAGGVCTVWSLDTRQRVGTIAGHTGHVFGIAWSPDGKQ